MLPKLLNFCKQNSKDLFLAAIIALVAIIGFGLGRLSKIRELKMPITIENGIIEPSGDQTEAQASSLQTASAINSIPQANTDITNAGSLVASKNGTKYYYPWCAGVSKIKEENKVFFTNTEEATKAGYSPAANCKGLK